MPTLGDIEVESLDLPNIREEYDEQELDLLGESLLKEQQSPIIVGPLKNGRRNVLDGSRRVRAARKKAMKKLMALVLDKEPTPEELGQYQLISDVHKKHLTPYERSMAILAIERANPGCTTKQLAAMLPMEESLFWRYAQAKKLSADSMAAYKAGDIGLTAMVEVSKLPHEDQPVLLQVKGGREGMKAERRKRTARAAPAVRAGKIKVPLPGGAIVTISADEISLEEAIEAATDAVKQMKAALAKGITAKSAMAYWKDVAAAG